MLIADHSLAMCSLVKRLLYARYAKDRKSCGAFAMNRAISKLGVKLCGKEIVLFPASWPKDPCLKITSKL